jgi:hypothetical protein
MKWTFFVIMFVVLLFPACSTSSQTGSRPYRGGASSECYKIATTGYGGGAPGCR